MSDVKVRTGSLKRTNIGFPTLWEAESSEGDILCLHFRYGTLTIYRVQDEKELKEIQSELIEERGKTSLGKRVFNEPKDDFCLSGSLSDEDLLILLTKHECIDDKETTD